MMKRDPGRFTLIDGMIVVAGSAFAIWARPEAWELHIQQTIQLAMKSANLSMLMRRASEDYLFSRPIAVVVTCALLMLGLRHRPQRYRRLAYRPGFVACAAVILAASIAGLLRFQIDEVNLIPGLPVSVRVQAYFARAMILQEAECGIAVAVAWMVLNLGGRWRAWPSMIERCSLMMGGFWITTIPLIWFLRR